LESYAERAVATEFGTLRVRAEALAGSEGIVLAGLALQEIIPATTIDAFDASGLVGSETDSGSPSFSFTLTRSGDTSASATVDYQVSGRGGNPVDANDFGGVFPSGQVTFQAGQAVSDPVSINVAGDTTDEADERFSVLFSQPSDGARLAVQSVPGTVIDDDETLAGVALGVAPERVTEAGNEELIYTFTRDHVDGSLQVNFTVGGTAVAGTDYNVTGATAFGTGSGSVTFADGDPVVEIRIAAVDDGLAENDESIAISLQDGSGYLADATPVRSTIGGDVTSHTIGFYQPDVSLFHLKETFTAGASDQYFAFGPGGNAGWIPLVGDWNGDGLDTIGLYQPSISLFHLKDTFTPGASDQYFAFGPGGAGWIPLAGDWDGDGVDTIGLYQPDASIFHLKDSFAPGASDHYFAFGPGGAGWTPLVGDWDGDGSDGIGFYQPDSSLFHLKDSFGSGASDQYFAFGPGGAGWTPLVGDWNGDRTDKIGLYQPDLSLFHLKDSFTPGASDQYFAFGPAGAGWTPLSGDWNGPAAATSPSGAKPVPSDAPTLSSPTARRTLSVSPEAAEGERPDRFGPTLTRSVTASRPSPSGFEASDGRTRGQTARFPGANSAAREASGRSQAALIDQALLLLQEEGSLSAG
jgi:hypothetical protein